MSKETSTKGLTGVCRYTIRLSLGQYEHEEITCELSNSSVADIPHADLMKEAVRTVLTNTTKYRKAQKELEQKKNDGKE